MAYITDQLALLTLLELIGHIIVLIGLFCWYGFMIYKRKEIFKDLRGSDGWQFWEGVAIFWLTFAPPLLVGHLFGVPISDRISMKDIWSFMEVVFFVAILGKSSQKIIELRFGAAKPDTTETKIEITKTESKKDEKPPLDEVEPEKP